MNEEEAKLVARLLAELDHQKGERATFESHWQEIARRLLPRSNIFKRAEWTRGERRTEYLFSSKGPINLERCSAVLNSLLTPGSQIWHKLRAKKRELNKTIRVKQYCEDYTHALFEARYKASANFASQNMETLQSTVAFGTGFLFVDRAQYGGWAYKSGHLAQTYLLENASGHVDRVKRTFKWKAYQAAEMWGAEALPDGMRKDLESASLKEYEFVHVMEPNAQHRPGSFAPEYMKYSSIYISLPGLEILTSPIKRKV